MGGRSAEHEVSLASGEKVVMYLDKNKYLVRKVVIDKDGYWRIDNAKLRVGQAIEKLISEKIDVVFIALHGPYGEDGTLQGLLDIVGIPYTGSGVLGSALGMNKVKAIELFKQAGLSVPKYLYFHLKEYQRNNNFCIKTTLKKIGLPCVVKPVNLGSSVGASLVRKQAALENAFQKAFEYDTQILVQKYLPGVEITCGVLGNSSINGELIALPPTLIKLKRSSFFDYHSKYTPGIAQEITPAPVDRKIIKKVQQTALKVHKVLFCDGMSRTDMLLYKNKIYVLEINTIPGLTDNSILPQQARVYGLEYPALLDKIVELALEKWQTIRMVNH